MAWFRQAAEKGDADAQSTLGMLYLTGEGLDPDDDLGLSWLVKAARQGHTIAQEELKAIREEGSVQMNLDVDILAWLNM